MSKCKVCGTAKSPYVLNNKTVCLKCDDLLFDLEVECDEESKVTKFPAKTPEMDKEKSTPVVKK